MAEANTEGPTGARHARGLRALLLGRLVAAPALHLPVPSMAQPAPQTAAPVQSIRPIEVGTPRPRPAQQRRALPPRQRTAVAPRRPTTTPATPAAPGAGAPPA